MGTSQTPGSLSDVPNSDWFARLLEEADIPQLQVMRERIDYALVLRADEVKAEKARILLEERQAKAAIKALGIKKPRKTRSDKGTKRNHDHASPTEDQQ